MTRFNATDNLVRELSRLQVLCVARTGPPKSYRFCVNVQLSNAREISVAFCRMGTLARPQFRRAGVPILRSFATVISRMVLSGDNVIATVFQRQTSAVIDIGALSIFANVT